MYLAGVCICALGFLSTVVAFEHTLMAVGTEHRCAVLPDGVLKCWGSNKYGQLGVGSIFATVIRERYPQIVNVGVGLTVISVTCGNLHTCALLSDGTVKCWGDNDYGQLGRGTLGLFTASGIPTAVALEEYRVVQLVSGWQHNCVVLSPTNETRCWGGNNYGSVGNGKLETQYYPTSIDFGDGLVAVAIGLSEFGSYAMLSDNSIFCWGLTAWAEQGVAVRKTGVLARQSTPVQMDVGGVTIEKFAVGPRHICAISLDGDLVCLGYNTDYRGSVGVLGTGEYMLEFMTFPSTVLLPTGLLPKSMAIGIGNTCVLMTSNALYCWGDNLDGVVGARTSAGFYPLPARFNTSSEVVHVVAMRHNMCAILTDQSFVCWGMNEGDSIGACHVDKNCTHGNYTNQTNQTADCDIQFSPIAVDLHIDCGAVSVVANQAGDLLKVRIEETENVTFRFRLVPCNVTAELLAELTKSRLVLASDVFEVVFTPVAQREQVDKFDIDLRRNSSGVESYAHMRWSGNSSTEWIMLDAVHQSMVHLRAKYPGNSTWDVAYMSFRNDSAGVAADYDNVGSTDSRLWRAVLLVILILEGVGVSGMVYYLRSRVPSSVELHQVPNLEESLYRYRTRLLVRDLRSEKTIKKGQV
jgi:alpha-tubulin suppressor-like RCC1 family protein